ncbi:MAG: enoyl-CoA hydratase [Planctomycetota bacterium]|nr:MAG: enoyl-CoA hydratase [Planctomycetota bacterium]
MSDARLVLLERAGHAAWLTLNRPEARNALSLPALRQLRDHCAALAADPDVWVVGITGAGDRAFCAGADLKERRGFSAAQVQEFVVQIRGAMDDVASLPQPVVAAINGACLGGGCELALACDLRVMDETAEIGLTETSLAIIPGAGGCVRLPRLVGAARAKELILLARRLGAAEARASGLVNFTAPAGGARAEAEHVLEALLKNGPLALRAAKAAVDGGLDLPVKAALEHEYACYQRIVPTQDRLEALAAFAEKRAPRFQGR